MKPEPISPPPNGLIKFRLRLQRVRALGAKFAPVAVGVVITLLALTIYNFINPPPRPLTTRELDQRIAQVMASATPAPPLSQRIYEMVQPSLVQIETKILTPEGKEEGGRGAGVVIDDQAQILTSLHVVADAIEIEVLFMDGTRSPAQLVARMPEKDIALLRALRPPSQIYPALLGNPQALRIGDEAFALGNPFGLTGSESAGIISGLNRAYRPRNGQRLEGLIQFDAAVNPGNSGGPLVNRYGEVVGIVTGLLNPTDENFFVGIGFAVPIDVAAAAAGPNPF